MAASSQRQPRLTGEGKTRTQDARTVEKKEGVRGDQDPGDVHGDAQTQTKMDTPG